MNSPNPLANFGLTKDTPALGTGRRFAQGKGEKEKSISPIDDKPLAQFAQATKTQADELTRAAEMGYSTWRDVPVRKRAAVLASLAQALITHQEDLAQLMTLEMGKPVAEARSEVANAAETFTHAAGLSGTIGGLELPTAKAGVSLQEKWHPLGPVLVITAFNFPIALWAWNTALAVLCGNSVVWKPAPQTPLFTMAVQKVIAETLTRHPEVPEGVFNFIIGSNDDVSMPLVASSSYPLVSATGSIPMGRGVGQVVAKRLGRVILELGGNAAGILTPSAHLPIAVRHGFFSATFNGGQRCTALRRLLVHESRFDQVVKALKTAYSSWPVGDIFKDGHRLPPLVDAVAAKRYNDAIAQLRDSGTELFTPAMQLPKGNCWVTPCLAILAQGAEQPQDETFGPLLYVQPYKTFDEAIAKHNGVSQGLSSGIFSNDLAEAQKFISAAGSDAGMVSVNDNTGGLEVTAAFGGTKESGIGSEKGSDSWKHYMRRQSVVLNTNPHTPPDMGIDFGEGL